MANSVLDARDQPGADWDSHYQLVVTKIGVISFTKNSKLLLELVLILEN